MIHPCPESIKYAIVCADNDLAWWIKNRSIDFLVDGKTITRDNTILIADNPLDPRYETTGGLDEQRKITRVSEQRKLGEVPPLWWINIRRKYPNLRHLIFGMSAGKTAVLRNYWLNLLGFKTWFWSYSCNMAFMFDEPETYFAGLNYDHYICWNEQQAEAMKKAGCRGQFHIVGPLFTEYSKKNGSNDKTGTYYYDTSFDNKYTCLDDYVAFLDDIIIDKECRPSKPIYLKLKRPLFPGQAAQMDVPYAEWDSIDTYTTRYSDPEGKIKERFAHMKDLGIIILPPATDNDEILCKAREIIAMPYSSIAIEAEQLGILSIWWRSSKRPRDYVPDYECKGAKRFRKLLSEDL